jgi:hypothetical protein
MGKRTGRKMSVLLIFRISNGSNKISNGKAEWKRSSRTLSGGLESLIPGPLSSTHLLRAGLLTTREVTDYESQQPVPAFRRDRRGAANATIWNLTQAIFAFLLRGWLNATKYEPRLCSFSDARTSDT